MVLNYRIICFADESPKVVVRFQGGGERSSPATTLRSAGKRALAGVGLGLASVPRQAGAGVRKYHERVVDHYNNPRNVGMFDKEDPTVGTGLVGAPACGDVMKLHIKVDQETGKMVDPCFKTFGCGSAIASSSVGTLSMFFFREIGKHLSLPSVKQHCSMLAEDAIKAAVKDYELKKAGVGKQPALS